MNESTTRNTLRLSLALSLPVFAVLAAIHVARADLKADVPSDYASVAAGQKVSAASVKNLLDNLDKRLGKVESSPQRYLGIIQTQGLNGYSSGDMACGKAFPGNQGAHICTQTEVLRLAQPGAGNPSSGPNATGLVAAGAGGLFSSSPSVVLYDCNAYGNFSENAAGVFWNGGAQDFQPALCNAPPMSNALCCAP